jgi:hypothetical protein
MTKKTDEQVMIQLWRMGWTLAQISQGLAVPSEKVRRVVISKKWKAAA